MSDVDKIFNNNNEESIANKMARAQKQISVAEFFSKNRHLLGFDNTRKALLTAVKEAVDNSLDACEEAEILPEITVEIIEISDNHYRLVVEDNGPGIVKDKIPHIFARLLYGSKFHKLAQTRGQQGIGISACLLYAQMTTGRAMKVISRTGDHELATQMELKIDLDNNLPQVLKTKEIDWYKSNGTRLELDIEATYQKGRQSVDEYLLETAMVNPHATIIYTNPKAEQVIYTRITSKCPTKPEEIKPHPYGVELGTLMEMARKTNSKTLQTFLVNDFTKVGETIAKNILAESYLDAKLDPSKMSMDQLKILKDAFLKVKIPSPSATCISPIGYELIETGLKKEITAEFYTSLTREPSVYRGYPFVVEASLLYGGDIDGFRILRFANRVPLLFQQGACSITKSIQEINWKTYGIQQSAGSLPNDKLIVLVHIASVWTPFTSEAKEAVAHYPEIISEVKAALQQLGRNLNMYLSKKNRVNVELKKKDYIKKYLEVVVDAIKELKSDVNTEELEDNMLIILEQERNSTKMQEKLEDFKERMKNVKSKDPLNPSNSSKSKSQTKLNKDSDEGNEEDDRDYDDKDYDKEKDYDSEDKE
ncbi:MAG: DNA topoisomerase VI subunit B [Candidatus Nanoarchaeia archaeon]|nr:DNA topoisomerase VI subunit B [Candidatus Nanoarchaeia archaeon]